MDNSTMETAISFLGQFSRDVQVGILTEATQGEMWNRRNALRKAPLRATNELLPENSIAFMGSAMFRSIVEMIEDASLPMPKLATTALSQTIAWLPKMAAMNTTIAFFSSLPPDPINEIIKKISCSSTDHVRKARLLKAVRCARRDHLQQNPPATRNDEEVSALFLGGIQNGYLQMMRDAVRRDLNMNGHGFRTTHAMLPLLNRQIEGRFQTPLVKIAEMYYLGRVNAHITVDAFEYLLRKGAKVDALSASDLPFSPLYYESSSMRPVIDHLTEMMKCAGSKKRMDTFCIMAELACRNGAILDLYQDRFRVKGTKSELKSLAYVSNKRPDNLIEIALLPQCPTALLRLFLEQQADGTPVLCKTDARVKNARRFGPNLPRGHNRAVTNIEWVMACIFRHLFDRSNSRGYRYPGEAGDLFIRKAEMMMHTVVDGPTLEGLHQLILAIRSIKKGLEEEQDDFESFKAHSWYDMCDAMSYFVSQPAQEEQIAKRGEPRHKFILADRWDPRKEWIRMTAGAPEAVPSIKEDDWNEFLGYWEDLVVKQGKGHRWYEVEKTKWFIPMEEAKEAFRVDNVEVASRLNL